jgi:hypothetical protein
MAVIPENFAICSSRRAEFAHPRRTIMKTARRRVTPAWFDYTGGHDPVNTAKAGVKQRNLREVHRLRSSILDPGQPLPLHPDPRCGETLRRSPRRPAHRFWQRNISQGQYPSPSRRGARHVRSSRAANAMG